MHHSRQQEFNVMSFMTAWTVVWRVVDTRWTSAECLASEIWTAALHFHWDSPGNKNPRRSCLSPCKSEMRSARFLWDSRLRHQAQNQTPTPTLGLIV